MTELVDILDRNSGGNPYHTGKPAPYIMTSRVRSMFLENYEYSAFDMRKADAIEIKLWSNIMTGRILYGETPVDLLRAYTEYTGRMRKLPDWVHNGVILGIMGGTEGSGTSGSHQGRGRSRCRSLVARLGGYSPNQCRNPALVELVYRQQLLPSMAAAGRRHWEERRQDTDLHQSVPRHGSGHDQLYQEAKTKGYLVQRVDG